MRQQYKKLIFLSAQTSFRHNEIRHVSLKTQLQRQGYKPVDVDGVYFGQTEKSLMVIVDSEKTLKGFLKLAASFDQESILYRDNENNCELFYVNGKREKLGQLKQICAAHRGQYSSYTKFNDKYYSTL